MRLIFSACLFAGLTLSSFVQADTLLVKRVGAESTATLPKRGSKMSTVEAQFGAPSAKHAAVGKPPITRWDYPAFTVYFEYSHVIDTVVAKASDSEMGAKPVSQPTRQQ